ncbi:MAG: Transcriptional regulator [Subtercola sp.]|nr:Transcriptional regulator [Subtercola sp.]
MPNEGDVRLTESKPDADGASGGAGAGTAVSSEGLHIGAKIREWRNENGATLAALAKDTELSTGYVSQVERGLANPSLETLKRLTDALGHAVAELFSNEAAPVNQTYFVSRRGGRKKIQFPGSGIMNELLSPDLQHAMEVIWVEAPAGASSGVHAHLHEGEECGVIIDGQMILWLNSDEITLNAGDAIYFDSRTPHRWVAGEGTMLRAVWLITPPSF